LYLASFYLKINTFPNRKVENSLLGVGIRVFSFNFVVSKVWRIFPNVWQFYFEFALNDKKNSKKFDLHCEIQPEKKALFG
jgi:hypothetical protein